MDRELNTAKDFFDMYNIPENEYLEKKIQFLKDSKLNTTIDGVLGIDPNQPSKRFGSIVDDQFFYNLLFVNSDNISKMNRIIEEFQNGNSKNTLILEGYSGSGKSTFLNYLAFTNHNEIMLNKFNYYVFDIDTNIEADNDEDFKNDISEKDIINQLLREQLEIFFKNKLLDATFNFLRKYSEFKALLSYKTMKKLSGKLKYFESEVNDGKKLQDFGVFLLRLSFNDLFVLLILTIIANEYNNQNTPHQNKYLICFDNLDKQISPSKLFSKTIQTVAHRFNNIQKQVNKAFTQEFEFTSYIDSSIKFCYCVREANINKCYHILGRINNNSYNLEFMGIYDEKGEDEILGNILSRRVKLFEFITSNNTIFCTFLKKLTDDKILMFRISQLFNYNYRQICMFFSSLYNLDAKKRSRDINNIIKPYITIMDIENVEDKEHLLFAARGVVFSYVINYLAKNMKLSRVIQNRYYDKTGVVRPIMNPIRKIITYILNENYDVGKYPFNISTSRESSLTIKDIYSKFDKIYTREVITKSIQHLFEMHKEENWCNFISFRTNDKDLELSDELIYAFSKEENTILATSIRVIPNPSCYTFLRYFVNHYEWFQYRNLEEKSLFSYCNMDLKHKLESKINYTYNTVKEWIDNIHIHYLEVLESKYHAKSSTSAIKLYLTDNATFKHSGTMSEEEEPHEIGYYHSLRIIDSHVSYLRALIVVLQNLNLIDSKLEETILDYIEKYLFIAFEKFNHIFGEFNCEDYSSLLDNGHYNTFMDKDELSIQINKIRERYTVLYKECDSKLKELKKEEV